MDLSFQLYSARNFTPWPQVIARLAALGYRSVEGFGGLYDQAGALRDALDAHGLTMPSAHVFPLSAFEDDWPATLAAARTLGISRLICPAPDDAMRGSTEAGAWIALAARLETVARQVTDAGLRFGWHNHDWEFAALTGGGPGMDAGTDAGTDTGMQTGMDLILHHAPSVEWEMDVAWVVRGGADPLAWIDRHGPRITAAHVKDIAPAGQALDEDGWADVGHGTMDWPALIAALTAAGVDLFVAEHDNPNDFERFASRSIAAFNTF